MRVIFASLPTYGHTYPLLPLAVAAVRAGHHVVFATAEVFLPAVGKAGLDGAPVGISLHEAFEAAFVAETRQRGEISQDELAPVIAAVFGDVMPRRCVADLGPLFERERPDLVIYEAGNLGAGLAARLAGIPAVCHTVGRVSPGPLSDAIRRTVLGYATELGVEGAGLVALGNPVIDICPMSAQRAEFVVATRRTPLRPVGWSEPGAAPVGSFLPVDRDRRMIYLTLGTAMGTIPVLRAAIAGLAPLDADVLVATGPTIQVGEIGAVPANVRVEQWVPQAQLLAHVELVVHHGGSGTTLGAFGAGLPQLLLPQGADQFTNADLVSDLGVGEGLVGEQVSADSIAEGARRLLGDSSVRVAAQRLAVEVAAMPAPAEVAAQLSALV
jgi:UDP:flavonoid glycosyltransferase YjiC (YdhE family)